MAFKMRGNLSSSTIPEDSISTEVTETPNSESNSSHSPFTSEEKLPRLSPASRARLLTRKLSRMLLVSKPMKVLPPIERTPIAMIRFTKNATPELINLVKERMVEARIVIVSEEEDVDGNVMLGISTTQQELEHEAEHLNLYKPLTLRGLNESLALFEGTIIMSQFEINQIESHKMAKRSNDDFAVYDSKNVFTSSDRVRIMNSLIESLPILQPGTETSNLARKLNETLHLPPNEIAARCHKMYLFDTLRKNDFIDVLDPLHSTHLKNQLLQATLKVSSDIPIQAYREYYGEEVAFYFAWMKFYIRALLFPGITGLVIFIIRSIRGVTIDTDSLTPFHGLLTFLWAVMFTQFWSREEARLAYSWGTWRAEGLKQTFNVRHEFKGTSRLSEVTKMEEKYYPENKRRLSYVFSAVVTLMLLAGAFFVMILSLNMQGYIKHKHENTSWYQPNSHVEDDCHHPFHYEFFASLSEKGNIFDSQSTIRSTLAVILHVALVLSMNTGYRIIAKRLTDWENHESQETYNNSLIFKRFFFEMFDSYIVLMYLAFYEQDVAKVRSELINVFNVDTFRRLLLEGVIPFITTKVRLRNKLHSIRDLKKNDDLNQNQQSVMEEEAEKEPYEEFDDYIEMIIQFGYITLFASAYPLAPFVAIMANFVELRLDAFKITHVHRRPWTMSVSSIGVWASLIRCIVWASAITNCMIFCFTSRQMVQYLPKFFTVDQSGEHDLKDGDGWIVVFIVFGIERLLLVAGIILTLSIPDIPEDVRIKEQQKDYIYTRMYHLDRSEKRAQRNAEEKKS